MTGFSCKCIVSELSSHSESVYAQNMSRKSKRKKVTATKSESQIHQDEAAGEIRDLLQMASSQIRREFSDKSKKPASQSRLFVEPFQSRDVMHLSDVTVVSSTSDSATADAHSDFEAASRWRPSFFRFKIDLQHRSGDALANDAPVESTSLPELSHVKLFVNNKQCSNDKLAKYMEPQSNSDGCHYTITPSVVSWPSAQVRSDVSSVARLTRDEVMGDAKVVDWLNFM